MNTPIPTPSRLNGVWSPVVTPFKTDLSPTTPSGSSGSAAGCLAGRRPGGLRHQFRGELAVRAGADRAARAAVAAGVDPARMMPGTGCCALTDSVRLTAHAVKLGCAGVLMLPPFYYKGVSDEGLFRNFAEIIERVGDARLRIYLYHIPPVSQVPISLGLIERLLKRLSRDDRRHEGFLGRLEQHQGDAGRGSRRRASTCSPAARPSCSPTCATAARAASAPRPT